MATANDFSGIYFTMQAIRMYHSPATSGDVEIVVVDNGDKYSDFIKMQCAHLRVKYVHMPSPIGTSQSRNRAIAEASANVALCIDSHVLFEAGVIQKLLDSLDSIKDDLYHGPLVHDNHHMISTHFNRAWRDEMYGTWGRAWQCPCGPDGLRFSPMEFRQKPDSPMITRPVSLVDGHTPVTVCHKCNKMIPVSGWEGHEAYLEKEGYVSIGFNPSDAPFEIPAQGFGLFLTRTKSWLGFNKDAIGFGGEEICTHDLYRQAGRKVICLPYLRWVHKFGHENGIPYPLLRYHRCRNYVLWYTQLGYPLKEIQDHFVETGLLTVQEWEYLLEDPVRNTEPPVPSCSTCPGTLAQNETPIKTPQDAFDFLLPLDRDMNQHMPKLKELAEQCDTVTEFTLRRDSTIAFAAALKPAVTSYSTEFDGICKLVAKMDGVKLKNIPVDIYSVPMINPTDLLFINDKHTGDRVTQQLTFFAPQVQRYIVLHNTKVYGELGEDGQPGIMVAVRKFLYANRDWSVVYHTVEQHGLTVLSRNPDDKPKPPGIIEQGVNFAKALATHVASGAGKVADEVYKERLDVCTTCDQRVGDQCTACGCDTNVKASWQTSECPLARWPQLPILQ